MQLCYGSLDSKGGVVTSFGLDRLEFEFQRGQHTVSSPKSSVLALEPTVSDSMGTRVPSSRYSSHNVYLTTHLPPDIKNECSYTSAPLYAFMVWPGTTVTLVVCFITV